MVFLRSVTMFVAPKGILSWQCWTLYKVLFQPIMFPVVMQKLLSVCVNNKLRVGSSRTSMYVFIYVIMVSSGVMISVSI